jgi:hypothetical protein
MIRRFAPLLFLFAVQPDDIVIDNFDSIAGWKATPSDGVSLNIVTDKGITGSSMRLDFDFHGHGGYAVIHKDLKLTVPGNYEFSFYIRGESPVNTLEFKLVDPTGDNVWWSNQPGFSFPQEWKRIVRKKRQVTFAWGPIGGGELRNIGAIEFAITAGTGGKGSVWIDDLRLTPLEPDAPYILTPKLTTTDRQIDIDFLKRREFGGLVLDWEKGRRPASYEISTSKDGETFTQLYSTGSSTALRDYIYLPESDARYIRVSYAPSSSPIRLKKYTVEPLKWSASMNDFLKAIAQDSKPGSYPRFFTGRQSYWTVIGVNGDTREGLIDTNGIFETGKAQFSIEPFIRTGNHLLTWADVTTTVLPEQNSLPIPSVKWTAPALAMTITSYAAGAPESSVLFGRYRVSNTSSAPQKATLHLALRPFQANPPWQFLNTPGGFAPIDSISFDGSIVRVNSSRMVIPVSHPNSFGAMSMNQGGLVDALRAGSAPTATSVSDNLGVTSGVLSYNLDLAPNRDTVIYIAVPLHDTKPSCLPNDCNARWASAQLESAKTSWTNDLSHVGIQLPASASRITESIRSNLAYVLINRDGPSIQPGSRSYERSWIRDGSLTSAALLRLGHAKEVKEFLEWYAGYQFANGKIPCCVDARGSDPVPENDSHGEFIYLVAEYYRHTGDRGTLEKMWPHVENAYRFMDSLRLSRKTPEFETADKRVFYGLLPQSISHEGYSAKPMHSYWDDFFALRGFKDVAEIARILGKPDTARYESVRDDFQNDLHRSITLAMRQHHIDYVPGAAELGDFDATSTTIALNPAGELGTSIEPAIRRTFDRYYAESMQRSKGIKSWTAYTPYEWRTVGSFIRLGQRQRALDMMNFFFQGQRPKEWHQWGEVVYRNKDTASFIGDMPHTWVGSDYIRSVLDMFAYERDNDSSLVVGAGVPASWIRNENGIRITGLSTHYGALSYTMRATSGGVKVRIESGLRIPKGGIVIQPPLAAETKVTSLPVTLTLPFKQ